MQKEPFGSRSANDLFGESARMFGQIVDLIQRRTATRRYVFLREDAMDPQTTGTFNQRLWQGLLQRLELCAYGTLAQTSRWASSAVLAHKAQDFLIWSSSTAELIEVAAHSYYVLKSGIVTLTTSYSIVSRCLSGNYIEKAILAPALEEELIKFIHQRPVTLDQGNNANGYEESLKRYLAALPVDGKPDFEQAYKNIAYFGNQSRYGSNWMYDDLAQAQDGWTLAYPPSSESEMRRIKSVANHYGNLLHTLLYTILNGVLLVLKLNNLLTGHSAEVNKIDLGMIPGWLSLKEDLKSDVGEVRASRH